MTRFTMTSGVKGNYDKWLQQVSFHNELVEQGVEVMGSTIDTSSFTLPSDHPLIDKARELATES